MSMKGTKNKTTKSGAAVAAPLKKTGHHYRRLGIRGRLVLSFALFALLLLIIVWAFQIQMLGYFYEKIKERELNSAADAIAECVGGAGLDEVVYNLAAKYGICVRVYSADASGICSEVASADASPTCMIHHLSADTLERFYLNALENDGRWSLRLNAGGGVLSRPGDEPNTDDGKPEGQSDGGVAAPTDGTEPPVTGKVNERPDAVRRRPSNDFVDVETQRVITVMVRVLTDDGGGRYAVYLNAEFTPMTSTVRTLSMQFWWIAAVILVSATLLAILLSAQISRPLVKMNETAKGLAAGNYNPDFVEEGYRETRELAHTLNYAANEISKTDRLQHELIANVSHDLRTPLTMITGYAEVMRDIPGENSPENVQVIIDEAKRLTDLVNDMLDLSKIRAGTQTPVRSVFDLTDTVRDIMQRYGVLTGHEGYTISFETDGKADGDAGSMTDAMVNADRTMILQVLYNLINNAVNYTGADKRVTVRQHIIDRCVRISVSDTGEGIAPELIPQIWDRYYRIDTVHRRAAVGSGIGLSIVKSILQMHGASFGVESTKGQGSTFWFELPLSDDASDYEGKSE